MLVDRDGFRWESPAPDEDVEPGGRGLDCEAPPEDLAPPEEDGFFTAGSAFDGLVGFGAVGETGDDGDLRDDSA